MLGLYQLKFAIYARDCDRVLLNLFTRGWPEARLMSVYVELHT